MTGEFELDHFEPQSVVPARSLDYSNLVYACRRCNLVKLDQQVEDPFVKLSRQSVALHPDGYVSSNQFETERLIRQLDLNSPTLVRWRVMWIRIVELAKERDSVLYRQLTGFPENLPNLSLLRPPSNSRPEGIDFSWNAKRQRGELPEGF